MAREQRWTSDSREAKAREELALATERDRIVRNNSVANDIRLNLPVSVQMPDGEGHFSKPSPRLLPYDPRSEIQRPYIKPPPNKTVCCTPDWDDSIHKSFKPPPNRIVCCSPDLDDSFGRSPCCCGPVSQSAPKCGSSGQQSGWSLSWSKSSKSPPSHNSRHRCQRQSQQHPSNPSSNTRHAAANSSASKQKSSSSQQSIVCGFLAGVSGSCSGEKSHNTVQFKGPPSGPSITERLHNSLTEKVHCTSGAGGNTRTSPINNSSMSGVFDRLVTEPLFSSISSRDNKRNGKFKKSPRNEPSATRTVSPSESNLTAEEHISDVIGDVRRLDNTRAMVPLPGCSSGMTRNGGHVPTSTSCASVRMQSKSSSSENGDSSDEKTRNDDNGNARVPPVIGQHGDNIGERNEQHSSFAGGGLHPSFSTTEGRGSYSKNVSSTTDSSLYHRNMHPRFGSALSESESIKETAHSELSETYTANQLSDQYCIAEIASTSSVCSSGQRKDVRSLRDVT